jgi:PleD family two-component response regulator
LLSQSQDDVPGALRRADQAMYEAKSRGRNRVHLHPLELAQA